MASTEQRAGFRLPWTGSAPAQEAEAEEAAEDAAGDSGTTSDDASQASAETEATADSDAAGAVMDVPVTDGATDDSGESQPPATETDTTAEGAARAAADPQAAPHEESHMSLGAEAPQAESQSPVAAETHAGPGSKKPAKFLAELVRAMRSAAEDSRTQTLESFRVEAKTFVEGIHTRSADEATELRRIADDDIAGIREWSKAEIARIRAETEERIGERKSELEQHIEDHAALIEREIEMVQGCVTGFEQDMEQFFARLNDIDDPAAFASVAQHLPEPPSLEQADSQARSQALTDLVRGSRAASATDDEPAAVADTVEETAQPAADWNGTGGSSESSEITADAVPVEAAAAVAERTDEPDAAESTADTTEAPAAAGEATESAAEGAAVESSADAATETDTDTDHPSESVAVPVEADEQDPRLAALGLSGDLGTAETEAAVDAASEDTDGGSIEDISEHSLAARLAGLVPSSDAPASGRSADAPPDTDSATTLVVVVGLVSVASIASFKRHLGRVPGVNSVGVSSGPDGEFVFKTNHEPSVALRDVVPSLPGFGARVVESGDGILTVSARDPEADA